MVARFASIAVALLISAGTALAAVQLPGVGRTFGYVPDATTAIRIAVAVWQPIYGERYIASERPFHATLTHGIWRVTGSLPRDALGGVAEANIRQKDGQVLRIRHGR
jgi:NTF2 fold immunity protein